MVENISVFLGDERLINTNKAKKKEIYKIKNYILEQKFYNVFNKYYLDFTHKTFILN